MRLTAADPRPLRSMENGIKSSGRRQTASLLRGLVVVAVLLPAVLLGGAAWRERVAVLQQAESTAEHTVLALAEHAATVLDGASILLRDVDWATRGKSWSEIAADTELRAHVAGMADAFAGMGSVGMVDAQGIVRVSSLARGLGVSVVDHDYFLAARDRGGDDVLISRTHTGRISGARQFAVVLPRRSVRGEFDGLVFVAIPLSHFTVFWKDFAPSLPHVVPLVRDDGELLARYPAESNPERLSVTGPFLGRALAVPKGFYTAASQVDGVERLNAYSKVGAYPLFISFSIEKSAVLAQWHARVAAYAVFAAAATALLLALGLAVIGRARREQHASESWKRTAQRLEAEIAVRHETETKLREAEAIISRRTEELSRLSQHLLSVREEERAAIAGDIHDDIGSALSAIRIDVALLHDNVRAGKIVPADTWARLERTVTEMTIAHRRIINALHPTMLDHLGLEPAIAGMVEECRQRHSITVQLRVQGLTTGLPPEVAIAAYRVVQEAINNVVQHANATRIEVAVERSATLLAVTITDDGVGFEPRTATQGRLGLVGMRERALKLGGVFEIGANEGKGTRVRAAFPLAPGSAVAAHESPDRAVCGAHDDADGVSDFTSIKTHH